MKKSALYIFAAAALLATVQTEARSSKRGVSENQFALATQLEILSPGVSWYYNWGNTPTKGYQSQVENYEGIEFVPMCWNANYNADAIRTYVKAHPGCKYLLGFNEPNFTAQANMTPAVAAQQWTAVKALADELGLELVAPALNYSPNPPYTDPVRWMDEFVALVGLDAFDYVAVHNYGGLGVMKSLATTFHEKYGKPVWVTEFCLWPNEGQADSRVEPAAQIASMIETVQWLEQTPWIYRYAWFKPVGKHENTPTSGSPCYGLIVTENGLGERHLSPQGYVYTYMSDFDLDRWNPTATDLAAADYVDQSILGLGQGNNPDCPLPIEITEFNAGAYVDYQFDVPADGEYVLTLTVSGEGEPVRFDPSLGVSLVDGDAVTVLAEPSVFTISGNDAVYTTHSFDLTLKAGHRRLRLFDGRQYQPSGIRISTVRLDARNGVEDILAETDGASADTAVYTVDGRRVDSAAGLATGIYIRAGKKFIVK